MASNLRLRGPGFGFLCAGLGLCIAGLVTQHTFLLFAMGVAMLGPAVVFLGKSRQAD